jgi:hypothetical protein
MSKRGVLVKQANAFIFLQPIEFVGNPKEGAYNARELLSRSQRQNPRSLQL